MSVRITFDKKLRLGYLYLFPEDYSYKIHETKELDSNPFLELDFDELGRVVGIELLDFETLSLSQVMSKNICYEKKSNCVSLRLNDVPIESTTTFAGIKFHFSEANYTGFIGFDIIDLDKYPIQDL